MLIDMYFIRTNFSPWKIGQRTEDVPLRLVFSIRHSIELLYQPMRYLSIVRNNFNPLSFNQMFNPSRNLLWFIYKTDV
jgi:hypothetical protein